MTRDDRRKAFIDRYQDETVGLFMRAFADVRSQLAEKNDERIGRAMIQQMRDARQLLGRIFDETFPKESAPSPPPTQPVNGHPVRK